jgi:hypothetical protein
MRKTEELSAMASVPETTWRWGMKTKHILVPAKMLVGLAVVVLILPPIIQASSKSRLPPSLTAAALHGDVEEAKALLSKGADVNLVRHHCSPLCAGIMSGNVDMVRLLLEKGADPNQFVEGRGTPLGQAFSSGAKPPLKHLLRLSSQSNRACAALHYGGIPLGTVFDNRYIPIIKLLLDYGADVNARYRGGEHSSCGSPFWDDRICSKSYWTRERVRMLP